MCVCVGGLAWRCVHVSICCYKVDIDSVFVLYTLELSLNLCNKYRNNPALGK